MSARAARDADASAPDPSASPTAPPLRSRHASHAVRIRHYGRLVAPRLGGEGARSWSRGGPAPGDGAGVDAAPLPASTVSAMSCRQRWTFRTLAALWLVTVVGFWIWWLHPDHIVGLAGFALTTAVLAYQFLMPAFFLFFIRRARRPHPALAVPPGLRVTFATTFVPGAESVDVLERTVAAMRDQDGYPHDVWVLDEGDDEAVRSLCQRLGVHHFSRRGRRAYQSHEWPFKGSPAVSVGRSDLRLS